MSAFGVSNKNTPIATHTSSDIWLGLDIGGTKTLCVALTGNGDIVTTSEQPTTHGNKGVINGTVDSIRATLQQATNRLGHHTCLQGIGIGIPGTVDTVTGHVGHAINLDVDNIELGTTIMERFGTKVGVENDVNAAAIGAYHKDAHTARNFVFLNLGTGVAAGIIINGKLVKGISGSAGEIGHIVINPCGAVCSCGQRGCIETVISGTALARAWPTPEGYASTDLLDKVSQGDDRALAVWHEFGHGVAEAVEILTLLLDPTDIVLGGGISHIGIPLLECVDSSLASLEKQSSFLTSLKMRNRIQLVDPHSPVGAIGAAFLTR